jgi:integrase
MSVHLDRARGRWTVRWREGGRQRARRFADEAAALAFDDEVAALRPQPETLERGRVARLEARVVDQGGVYPYETAAGTRWRIVYRQSDGVSTTRRGFESRSSAAAARRRAIEQVRRGEVRACRATFGEFWAQVLEEKRPYVTEGTLLDYAAQGRLRLLPTFGELKLAAVDEDRVRAWLAGMAQLVAAGELSAKTVNNSRTCLSMTLNEAVRRGHLPFNPCRYVPELPVERVELDYLRLDEIDRYLDSCGDHYRALAEFLIGTGARISEALAVRWPDVDLDAGVARISRQRGRTADDGTVPTKGKRFRSVQIGPRLAATLREVRVERLRSGDADGGWLFLCPPQVRGAYCGRTEPVPPSRKTAHDWHEWALQDAGLRDMPLHALRHTAATAWLTTGHPLIFVQRQLGHRSITTTEEHYGHLEVSFVREAAAKTEALIAAAGRT